MKDNAQKTVRVGRAATYLLPRQHVGVSSGGTCCKRQEIIVIWITAQFQTSVVTVVKNTLKEISIILRRSPWPTKNAKQQQKTLLAALQSYRHKEAELKTAYVYLKLNPPAMEAA